MTLYQTREEAMLMTQHLANRTRETAYTLYDGTYHIATELDIPYWPDAAQVAEFAPTVIGTIPDEPPPDDGPGQEGDIDGIPQGWRCRACDDMHYGKGCPEVMKLLYARPLAYSPKQIMKAHANRTLITLLCNLDRIELEAHAQAFAAWLCDEVARAEQRPASYAALPEYTARILRRWRSLLAIRPLGVIYELLGQ